jgi:hypothetical protein
MQELLLVKNLNSRVKYALEQNVPLHRALEKPTPSYHTSHWKQHEQEQHEKKLKELEELEAHRHQPTYSMKYPFSSWQSLQDPYDVRGDLRAKSHDWA